MPAECRSNCNLLKVCRAFSATNKDVGTSTISLKNVVASAAIFNVGVTSCATVKSPRMMFKNGRGLGSPWSLLTSLLPPSRWLKHFWTPELLLRLRKRWKFCDRFEGRQDICVLLTVPQDAVASSSTSSMLSPLSPPSSTTEHLQLPSKMQKYLS